MFNTFVNKSTEYVPYEKSVSIQEHRAPTDDSIKLYEEIKEKAYDSLLNSIQISSNTLLVTAIFYKEHLSCNYILGYKYILNGKEYSGKEQVNMFLQKEDLLTKLYEFVSEDISRVISRELFKTQKEEIRWLK